MGLLLLSNSTSHSRGYLDHAMPHVLEWLGPVRRLLFVPFALHDHASYTARVRERFASEGVEVKGLAPDDPGARDAVEAAEAVFVGGGNTFRLLARLQTSDVLDLLGRRARAGMPYLGASAGTNLACPTIRTTNDMPIVEPPGGLQALGLVSFQINPHYVDADPGSSHMGESRETRIREYLEENPGPVVGLREGSWLRVHGHSALLEGPHPARVFRRGREPEEVGPGRDLGQELRE
jgi:dipeptidase E